MAGDAYLPADGEIEAEHAWVNEWAEPDAAPVTHEAIAPMVTASAAILPVQTPAITAPVAVAQAMAAQVPAASREAHVPAAEPADDQLLRDIMEIEFARDMLEREPEPKPTTRRRIRMPVTVGGMLGFMLVTAASVVAGLIKVR